MENFIYYEDFVSVINTGDWNTKLLYGFNNFLRNSITKHKFNTKNGIISNYSYKNDFGGTACLESTSEENGLVVRYTEKFIVVKNFNTISIQCRNDESFIEFYGKTIIVNSNEIVSKDILTRSLDNRFTTIDYSDIITAISENLNDF